MINCIRKASIEPITIPVEIVMPMKAPTWPCASPQTVLGAFTAHRVLTQPFESENSTRLKMMKPSVGNSFGATSKEISKKVMTKIVRMRALILIVGFFRIKQVTPPQYLPIESHRLKMPWMKRTCQLLQLFQSYIKVIVSVKASPGQQMNVRMKTQRRAQSNPSVMIKFYLV